MKNTVIHTPTQEELNKVLEIFEDKGWKWNNWCNPTDNNVFWIYEEDTCISYKNNFGHAPKDYYEMMWDKIITFQEFLELEWKKTPKRKTWKWVYVREDGIEFSEETIDWKTLEDLEKERDEAYAEGKRLNALLTAHRNLFSKK